MAGIRHVRRRASPEHLRTSRPRTSRAHVTSRAFPSELTRGGGGPESPNKPASWEARHPHVSRATPVLQPCSQASATRPNHAPVVGGGASDGTGWDAEVRRCRPQGTPPDRSRRSSPEADRRRHFDRSRTAPEMNEAAVP